MDIAADRRFTLGGTHSIGRLGYGAMRMSGQPGNFGPYPDWEGGKAFLREVVARGIDFIDTARAYGTGWNERLIADALYPYADDLVIATKGGVEKPGPEFATLYCNGDRAALLGHIDESRRNLRIDRLPLYYLHLADPAVRWEDQIETLGLAQAQGLISMIGLSNVSLEKFEAALALVPIAAVQNRFNIKEDTDTALLKRTAELGIAYVPYGPLGAIGGIPNNAPLARLPGGTAAALGSLLSLSANIVPIPGTTSLAHLDENLQAWEYYRPESPNAAS